MTINEDVSKCVHCKKRKNLKHYFITHIYRRVQTMMERNGIADFYGCDECVEKIQNEIVLSQTKSLSFKEIVE